MNTIAYAAHARRPVKEKTMNILNKLFKKNNTARLADCIAVIVRGYAKKASKAEMTKALNSKVSCPSCRASFTFEQMVQIQGGGNMLFVCPSCKSIEAQIKSS
jgi:Zn finger protein HypA/HybF involved in hydrogenase expression